MTAPTTAPQVILEALGPMTGQRILDIGCGSGSLRRPLVEAGAVWHGLDPEIAPAPDRDRAGAEAMPYPDAAFDGAICVNALHHVPVAAMDQALSEAARVLKPGGRLVVIEPDATGDLSMVLAVIDDETLIRRKAQAALDGAVASAVLEELRAFRYTRRDSYDDFADFCARITSVAPERAAMVAAHRDRLQAAFRTRATLQDGRPGLEQPMTARILRRPERTPTR